MERTMLEKAAIRAWKLGCGWLMTTTCVGCGEVKVCAGKRRDAMRCLECHDEGRVK